MSKFSTRPSWAPSATLPIAEIVASTVRESSNPMLNEQQLAALTPLKGHAAIIAGAGTGKTLLLASRIDAIHRRFPKSKIHALTFSRKAALELKSRIGAVANCQVSTFHSISYRLLMSNGFKEFRLDTRDDASDQIISKLVGKTETSIENVKRSLNRLSGTDPATEAIRDKFLKTLVKNRILTFDALQPLALKLLNEKSHVLHQLQKTWDFILADEFQDTDEIQQRLIELISARSGNLCVVGDLRQSIYGFRGADPSIMSSFAKTATVHELTRNYRCSPHILGLANRIMYKETPLSAVSSDLSCYPQYLTALDEADEAAHVVEEIKKLHRKGIKFKDVAVIYRSSSLTETVMHHLLEANVPFTCKNHVGFRFSRQPYLGLIRLMQYATLPHADNFEAIMPFLYLRKSMFKVVVAIAKKESVDYLAAAQKLPLPFFHHEFIESMANAIRSTTSDTSPKAAIHSLLDAGYGKYVGDGLVPVILSWSEKLSEYSNIIQFLGRIQELQDQLKKMQSTALKNNNDCVQLMTIHASKGLEFDTVFLIGCYDGALPSNRDGADPEEERRLLYVAVTRSKKNLYISYPVHTENSTDTNEASRFLREAFSYAK